MRPPFTHQLFQLDRLFRQNTIISKIIAGVQVGTPSQLSDGALSVPISLHLYKCRAAFLHIRDSLTQNLEGNNRDSFDNGNVINPETFQLGKLFRQLISSIYLGRIDNNYS